MDMDPKITTTKKRHLSRALAALAVVVGAGLFTATPAAADHGPDVSFSFSFGSSFPFYPVPVYREPVVVYREPVVVYREPVYAAPRVYYQQPYGQWKKHNRHHDRWDDRRDGRYDRDRSDYRDTRW
jgi:hypothetical protein